MSANITEIPAIPAMEANSSRHGGRWKAIQQSIRKLVHRRKGVAKSCALIDTVPNELLHNIVKYIPDRRDLHSLALTCRKLNIVSTSYLYAEYQINHSCKPWEPQVESLWHDPSQLLLTLLKNPDLVSYVKSAKLGMGLSNHDRVRKWYDFLGELPAYKAVRREVDRRIEATEVRFKSIHWTFARTGMPPNYLEDRLVWILLMLPKVERLSIELWSDTDQRPAGDKLLDLLKSAGTPEGRIGFHGFKHLTYLKIRFSHSVSPVKRTPDISSILLIPTLVTLVLKDMWLKNPIILEMCPRRSSKITSVRISPTNAIHSPDTWIAFLGCFERLENFVIRASHQYLGYEYVDLVEPLYVHKDSLKSIVLKGAMRLIKTSSTPKISFLPFHKLESLTISTTMVWKGDYECNGNPAPPIWASLEPVLPPSLRQLVIYRTRFPGTMDYPVTAQIPMSEEWARMISREAFPDLREVIVLYTEYMGGIDGYKWAIRLGMSWSRDKPWVFPERYVHHRIKRGLLLC